MQKKNLCYKSDFKITEKCDAGYAMRFRFLYYVGSPSKAYMASYDGETFTNCHLNEDGTLTVCFDDHGLGIGDLMVERRYYFNDEQYQSGVCDVVIPAAPVVVIDKDAPQLSKLFAVVLSTKGLSYLECYAIVEPYWMYGGFGEAAYANEEERKAAEASRVIAENNRVLAENKRESDWTKWFTETKNTFSTWFTTTKNEVKSWYDNTKKEVSAWFTSTKNEVATWFTSTKNEVKTWFDDTKSSWTSWKNDTTSAWSMWFGSTKSDWTTWFTNTSSVWATLKSTIDKWYSDTQSSWTTWFSNAKSDWSKWFADTKTAWTSWFNATKSEWTTLKADATAATNAANTAKTAADTATTNANAAAARCETATTSANKATSDANAAAAVALSAADTAKSEAQSAKAIATDASNINNQSKVLISEMNDGLEAQKAATANAETAAASAQAAAELASKAGTSIMIRPTGMSVDVPKVVPVGATAMVEVSMSPESSYASKVFQSKKGCFVAPDGYAEFTEIGTAVFYVVPTLNDTIAKKVEVTVRALESLQAENGTEITMEDGSTFEI